MRAIYISVLGMAAISIASAGQIEIGANNSSGNTTSGLTAAFVGTTTWAEKNYVTNLFVSDTLSNGANLPDYQNSLQQFTDTHNTVAGGPVTFGMLDDAANGNNYWSSPNNSSPAIVSSMTLNIGEYKNVSSAYILLSDYYGVANTIDNDTVTFLFAGGISGTVDLSNGIDIDSVHDCTGPNPAATTPEPCPTGPSFNGTTSAPDTDIAWTSTYAEANNLTPFSGTEGNATLIDLSFDLSAFAGDKLTGIVVTDDNNLSLNSRLALSAVTIAGTGIAPVPEPSTVFLLLAGLGVVGFLGLRRKVSQ
jgi:hypothetical protein